MTEQYYEDIYKFCCAKCRNADVASDITQETFLIFYNNRKKLVDKNIRSYFYTTANNLVLEYIRKISKEKTFISLDECDLISREDDFYQNISEEEFEKLLTETQKKLLNILTPSEREIFIKLYIEKKSVSLVSDETGLTQNNINVKSHRIRKKSKQIILNGELLLMILVYKLFVNLF